MSDGILAPLTTTRLRLRVPQAEDAAFLMRLMNDHDWLRFIGDRGIRAEPDAVRYAEKQRASFREHGFGLFVVETLTEGERTGICGLVMRPTLESPDLGFAFLREHRGKGYAVESAACVLDDAQARLGHRRILAITDPDNDASIRVLRRVGMVDAGAVTGADGAGALRLFAWTPQPLAASQHSS